MNPKIKNILSTPLEKIFPLSSFRWICFFWIVLSNSWLSYGSPSLLAKPAIILAGLVLPLSLLFLYSKGANSPFEKCVSGEKQDSPSTWVFLIVIIPAVALRLWNLTTLLSWPVKDEGIFGYFAIRLCQNWNWSLLKC